MDVLLLFQRPKPPSMPQISRSSVRRERNDRLFDAAGTNNFSIWAGSLTMSAIIARNSGVSFQAQREAVIGP
ncbi:MULTISPECIES: hypothetical protein [unclassified Mesorhizobium]|uniref:hypothetical protein n=1 Tax=unclassified Mesorhizobium TaxID=325217 RepID=UPI001127199B|nr:MULTISPECIES: hypothetical protein [unclassified Mesorhizobium]TPJ41664.1 hypothetical protein FJ437_23920 [Mesorhizobium sp. B2-6-6]TPK46406.1 hypothetical protein FJ550_24675 [Mesorhizobium sp. B2-5-2]MBZ9896069.1 hypothetical protein [Mesorhizobium sp. BR1-1-6]MBZ9916838.1 hypothetical protein [Mesorhizobium sp. BR1-1-7]MBZ9971453.1 hypothetical protein [Mesorhizobium sp. BR1-1-12]